MRKGIYWNRLLGVGLCASVSVAAQGANLIVNPNFSAGNTGFTSGYAFSATSLLNPGSYAVGADAFPYISSATSFGDHTTGTGLMGLFNGSTVANTVMWQETVAVNPQNLYNFSGWISTFDRSGETNNIPIDIHPADYKFVINGTQVGTFALPSPSNDGVWGQFSADWQSGAATSAQIQIFIVRTDNSGNDGAIDDLSFAAVPEPASAALLGMIAVPLLMRRRKLKNPAL